MRARTLSTRSSPNPHEARGPAPTAARSRRLLPLLLGALLLLSAPALGRTPAEIQTAMDAATREFKEERFAEALESYSSIQSETKDLRLLYMIGRCHEELGHLRLAVSAYEQFLVGDAPPEIRERALARTHELRELLEKGTLHLVVTPGEAVVRVDGVVVGTGPRLDLEVASGARLVEVKAEGRVTHRESVTVPEAGEVTTQVTLAAVVQEPPVPPETTIGATDDAPMSELEGWAWGLGTTGVAIVMSGAVTAAMGEADHQELVSTPGYGTPVIQTTRERALLLESRGDTLKTTGYALLGVGSAAVVGSAVMFVLDASDTEGVSVGAGPTDGGAGCFVRGSF